MKMVGNSCKTSSKRICIDMQNHMDPWSLPKSHAWNFSGLESLPSCCAHKFLFVSELVCV